MSPRFKSVASRDFYYILHSEGFMKDNYIEKRTRKRKIKRNREKKEEKRERENSGKKY